VSKKLTIADLLKQKDQLKKKEARKTSLYIDSLDAEITIQEPNRSLCIETLEMVQDEARSEMADPYLVYHSVIEPNLKDSKLQEEFGCVQPTDIVEMLFRPGEISAISGHALQLAGFKDGVRKVDEELKN